MRDIILLDNESTTSIFCNENYVVNIKTSNSELPLNTNGGVFRTKQVATVPGLEHEVWYSPKAMTNIIAFHEAAKQYRITYDNRIEDAFHVHTENGIIKFTKFGGGLYAYQ